MVDTFIYQTRIYQTSNSPSAKQHALVLSLGEVGMGDIALVGGKNASLGELIQQLEPRGISVPLGFATTAHAYRQFLDSNGLREPLRHVFAALRVDDLDSLHQCGEQARQLMLQASFPPELEGAIAQAYEQLCQQYGPDTDVAVRSSATAEDLPDASFAGQQETYLNVHGLEGVLAACHRCFASIFTDRAISYRHAQGFDQLEIALSVGVQKMVRSDLASAGVMFSIDTETGFRDAVVINAAYGLGETVVQGMVNPDEYRVFKPTLSHGFRPILNKQLGSKQQKLVYDLDGIELTKLMDVEPGDRTAFALNDDEILQLAHWACLIEAHYSQVRGVFTPMDIEWAKDGITQQLAIVQARPETVHSQTSRHVLRTYHLLGNHAEDTLTHHSPLPTPLATGQAVGEMIGQGKARILLDASQINQFQPGEVLVTNRTDPDWEPIMKRASAVVTNQGGRTCHAAIIARELGLPAIVGCGDATTAIANGQAVTVSCAEGEAGQVYPGLLPYEVDERQVQDLPATQTQIMMNVGNPEEAMRWSHIPNDGVGLARLEFIIANHIRVHPLALLHFDQLTDAAAQAEIADLTSAYPNKADYFVDQLAYGVGTIAAAFYPKPVIVRLSDFKSNEYANLLGGRQFEPLEDNPMLGWRGASRYYDDRYRDGFALECQALRRVRDDMGLTNVIVMIPFCRTPNEGWHVLTEMAKHHLIRGCNGLQVYVMCELPSNIMLAEEFSHMFDGFSIGSNDLTQLTLGLDRDSARVAHLFDERNEAVKRMISQAIAILKRNHRKIGICGQAPSDYPEFIRFLVTEGIDSISLNPDSILKARLQVADIEAELQSAEEAVFTFSLQTLG